MMKLLQLAATLLCVAGLAQTLESAEPPEAGAVKFFEERIRPVLVEHCYECHSADSEEVQGELLLDTRQATWQGGESGAAVVPGNVEESLLIQAIRHETFEMPPDEMLPEQVVADFVKWVEMGAPDPRDGEARLIRRQIDFDEARRFWAFQPPGKTAPPSVDNESWPRGEIDRYVLAALQQQDLAPVADADRIALLRRINFDLIGLPPTPDELTEFVADDSPQAIERAVDRLLDSSHFGERWGRHWLDVARYAESNGRERNYLYPHAWRYRDYVIASFNADKPYDRFVQEQIAGDLLPSAQNGNRNEQLIATGFLAIGPKLLNERNSEIFRMDLVDEQIDVATRAVMALTVSCARCHNHKFDPIPTSEYYALAGIFRSTQTLYGTGGRGNRQVSKLITLESDDSDAEARRQQHQQHLEQVRQKLRKAQGALKRTQAAVRKRNDTTAEGRQQVNEAKKRFGAQKIEVRRLAAELKRLEAEDAGPRDVAMGVAEGDVADCHVYLRGEVDNPGEQVARGFLTILSDGAAPRVASDQSGRRELARWLTSAENPLTARVMVNRIWNYLFGRGLVRTVDNFGATGARPSHPELLDYLAVQFMQEGWSVKRLIRTIVLSRTYQLSTDFNAANYEADPDNVLLWRASPRRLDAESLRDAMLTASGQLDATPADASPVAKFKDTEAVGRGADASDFNKPNRKRSVYLPIVRNAVPEVLKVFDFAEPSILVGRRDVTTVPAQALYMMNSAFVASQSEHLAKRLLDQQSLDDARRVELAFQSVLSRQPSTRERDRALEFIKLTADKLDTDGNEAGRQEGNRLAAWTGFCQALFACAEFRYLN